MRKTHHPWIARTGGLGLVASLKALTWTLDLRAMYFRAENDPANPFCPRRGIYVFWHEYITIPFCLRGNCNLSMLLSRHRDAEWLAHAASMMGFGTVRGSSSWGSIAALKELIKVSRRSHLTITPDGPQGPRREMAPGAIYLASKLQMPIIPMGFGMDRPVRLGTWDKFALPRPFSRARMVMGEAINVPKKLSREDVEWHRMEVQRVLNQLTDSAEKWAESHLPGENEVAFFSTATPLSKQAEASSKRRFWLNAASRDFRRSPAKQPPAEARDDAPAPTILPFRNAS
ncbi:lysophospholipid acyltransferase family protein [Bremerella sp. JC817]|uniref:lysophospholipid acyltransferase family protein n=1 Tax=Bremerella sp. JC817 TaxID=3231756 RepID=UPI003458170D